MSEWSGVYGRRNLLNEILVQEEDKYKLLDVNVCKTEYKEKLKQM